jgi:hypothetical protein
MIKNFQEFNEGIVTWARTKLNSDENTAMGIYEKAKNLSKSDITTDDDIDILETNYYFTIDDFSIKSHDEYSMGMGRMYSVSVDNVRLKTSVSIAKKIFKLVEGIYNTDIVERNKINKIDNDFVKKDAKLHFTKRVNL